MKQQPAPSRLAREGFVPAGPEKRITKRHMLIPKTGDPSDYLPTINDFSDAPRESRVLREIVETADLVRENGHTYLVARVSSYTIDALAAFEAERADLEPDGSDELGGDDEPSIAAGAFDCVDLEEEHDGREPDQDDEPSLAAVNPSNRSDHGDQLAWSSGSDSDREGGDDDEREHDFPRERQKYIADRQQPGREYKWRDPEGRERHFVDPPRFDGSKDREELRKSGEAVH